MGRPDFNDDDFLGNDVASTERMISDLRESGLPPAETKSDDRK